MNTDPGNGEDRDPDPENEGARIIPFPRQDRSGPGGREKLFNLPPVTGFFIVLLLGIHGLLQFLTPVQQYDVYAHYGFVAGAYTGHAPFTTAAYFAPLTYMLLHGSWAHVLLNSFMLAAFGAGLERLMGGTRMVILFVLCGLAAIAVQFALAPDVTEPVIGASGGLSGFFAAVLVMMQKGGGVQRGRFGLWPLIIVWIGVDAAFGISGAGPGGNNVAWIAHIGGFLSGFVFLKPVMRLRLPNSK